MRLLRLQFCSNAAKSMLPTYVKFPITGFPNQTYRLFQCKHVTSVLDFPKLSCGFSPTYRLFSNYKKACTSMLNFLVCLSLGEKNRTLSLFGIGSFFVFVSTTATESYCPVTTFETTRCGHDLSVAVPRLARIQNP